MQQSLNPLLVQIQAKIQMKSTASKSTSMKEDECLTRLRWEPIPSISVNMQDVATNLESFGSSSTMCANIQEKGHTNATFAGWDFLKEATFSSTKRSFIQGSKNPRPLKLNFLNRFLRLTLLRGRIGVKILVQSSLWNSLKLSTKFKVLWSKKYQFIRLSWKICH